MDNKRNRKMKDIVGPENDSIGEEEFSEPNVSDPDENILDAQAMEKGVGNSADPIDEENSGFHIEE